MITDPTDMSASVAYNGTNYERHEEQFNQTAEKTLAVCLAIYPMTDSKVSLWIRKFY